jgi:predicted acyl esterase
MKAFKVVVLVCVALVVAVGAALLLLKPTPAIPDLREGLGSFFDRGYDLAPRYGSYEKESRYITLSDGTRIAADIFVPTEPVGPSDVEMFPTILEYSPYNRSFAQPGMRWWERLYLWWKFDLKEAVYDRALSPDVRGLIALGYAYASVDMRGSGASFGSQMPLMPQLGADGAEVVDWIASQEWSDGNVGMRGQSFLGWSQFATASHAPEALKCIAPALIIFDTYSEGMRPGGIMATRWLSEYSHYLSSFNVNRFDLGEGFLPAAPALDEDGDGRFVDEIPLADAGDSTLFVDDGPPRYADGRQREGNTYYSATLEHRENLLVERFMGEEARYSDAQYVFEGDTLGLTDTSPGAMLKPIVDRQIPVLHIGGWFDGFVKGTTKLYSSMQGLAPARMLIGPRFHIPADVTGPYKTLFGYEGNLAAEIAAEEARFYDWCLRGVDNGVDREPPVSVYVMNKGWRTESEWPIERQEILSLHLNSDRALSETPGAPGTDPYDVDFAHQSDFGTNRMNRWILMWSPDTVMLRTVPDSQTLIYETGPLDEGLEVTGHPVVHLWVGSNQSDADVFVYLGDVDTEGQVHYVTEGQLRASFHGQADAAAQTRELLEVQPDLPWHGYGSRDLDTAPFAGGGVVELSFDLMPTAWYFQAGHKIRISIAGADLDNFELNPVLCPGNDPSACVETMLEVHRGPARPSRIDLPVIPDGGGG